MSGKHPTIHSEHARMSPADQAARIRRAARALKQGTMIEALLERGFSYSEIVKAKAMLAEARK